MSARTLFAFIIAARNYIKLHGVMRMQRMCHTLNDFERAVRVCAFRWESRARNADAHAARAVLMIIRCSLANITQPRVHTCETDSIKYAHQRHAVYIYIHSLFIKMLGANVQL